jgi:hypothetical protein
MANKNVRFVHIRSRDGSRFVSLVHECHHFIITADNQLGQILHVRSHTGMLTNPKIPRIFGIQQVPHFLIVNLRGYKSDITREG